MQNIPLRGKIKKAIRSVFIAPAGAKLVKADFSQLEVRIYAHYTMEPVLLAAYPWDGPARDVHQGVADELGIARWRAKNVMFAGAYGAGGPKLAETAGVEKDKAEAFLGRMRERIPAFVIWPKHIGGLLARQGFIETWLGWRNYYPLYWSPIKKDQRKALREAANLPIQGTASGIVKMFMARMHKLCPKYEALPILQVHDEMVYEVPGGNVAAFAEMLKAIGRQIGVDIGLRVPLEVNVEAGPNWGDTSEL